MLNMARNLFLILPVFVFIFLPSSLSLSSQISAEQENHTQEEQNRIYILSQIEYLKSLKPKNPKISAGLHQYIQKNTSGKQVSGKRSISQKGDKREKIRVIFNTSGHTEKTLNEIEKID